MTEMSDPRRVLPRLARLAVVGIGLGLLPVGLPAQGIEFERLWSHDTGG